MRTQSSNIFIFISEHHDLSVLKLGTRIFPVLSMYFSAASNINYVAEFTRLNSHDFTFSTDSQRLWSCSFPQSHYKVTSRVFQVSGVSSHSGTNAETVGSFNIHLNIFIDVIS